MSAFAGLLAGGSPKWLSFFQKGKPGELGYYFAATVGRTRKLYGPIKSKAHAYVLSALVHNEPTMWPNARTTHPALGRGVNRYDSAEELEALVKFPEEYDYGAVKLLPTSRLKLGLDEGEALEILRVIDFPDSGWHHFFGFERPSGERQLFPFAYAGEGA